MNQLIEIIAVVLNLIYLFLLIKERISCWFFGILGSIFSIYLFYAIGLYSESILYLYYVIIGMYGYWLWKKKEDEKDILKVQTLSLKMHFLIIVFGIFIALGMGFYFKMNTDAAHPYLDAFTTIFSFIASFLEAKKILSAWIFWIIINTATIVLYLQQGLLLYLFLTLVYVVFSGIGFLEWQKKYQITKYQIPKTDIA